ncbi:MAG: thiol:disulfide interchange protein DsbA/DsbL [Herminiimonas sp.]|nr:thiol:disulfide interchange protein DsbA/DsbL [Herminiimonas sp.]
MRSTHNFLQKLIATLGLGLGLMAAAHASPAAPVNGAEYRTLEKVQTTDSGKKVEVTEFFWYSCPHCNAFEPALADWVKKQGDNIVFKRVPVAFRESFQPQQRLYYALEAMGKADEMQKKVFQAIHVERKNLDTDAAIADFVAAHGIDRKKFVDVYGSFGVQSKVRRAAQLQEAYKIDGVPMIAIDGRFMTSPSIVGTAIGNQPENTLQVAALQVMDWLVAKSAKEHKSAAAPAATAGTQVAANGKK